MQLTGSLLADSIIAQADGRTRFLANFWPSASAGAPPARAAAVDPETKLCLSQLCDYPWEGFWNAFSSYIYKIMPIQLSGKLKTLTEFHSSMIVLLLKAWYYGDECFINVNEELTLSLDTRPCAGRSMQRILAFGAW